MQQSTQSDPQRDAPLIRGVVQWVVAVLVAALLHAIFCASEPPSGHGSESVIFAYHYRPPTFDLLYVEGIYVPANLPRGVSVFFGIALPLALLLFAFERLLPPAVRGADRWLLGLLGFLVPLTVAVLLRIPRALVAVPWVGAVLGGAWILLCTSSLVMLVVDGLRWVIRRRSL